MMLESVTSDEVLGQWGLRYGASDIQNQIDPQNSLIGPKTVAEIYLQKQCALGRGLKTKSWNIKTRLAELGVFMHKFAIENDPKP